MTADLSWPAPCLGGLVGTAGRGGVQLSSLRCNFKLFSDLGITVKLEPFFSGFGY